jgi:hypothetical protein
MAPQQLVEAFIERYAKPYLVRDRDAIYGNAFRHRIRSMGIKEIIAAPRSPWQNAFAEQLIGSIRRECLDHGVVLNQRHLRKMLESYLAYYHRSRTHLALEKDAPEPRAIMRQGLITAVLQLGGLHRATSVALHDLLHSPHDLILANDKISLLSETSAGGTKSTPCFNCRDSGLSTVNWPP